MAWIAWNSEEDATGELKALFARYRSGPALDNVLRIHSLNPPSLQYHYELYDHLMRGPSGLSRAEREMIAVVVSKTNDCFY